MLSVRVILVLNVFVCIVFIMCSLKVVKGWFVNLWFLLIFKKEKDEKIFLDLVMVV